MRTCDTCLFYSKKYKCISFNIHDECIYFSSWICKKTKHCFNCNNIITHSCNKDGVWCNGLDIWEAVIDQEEHETIIHKQLQLRKENKK